MTIGQRIAQCRKQLGISQEALGEKLDVSRQAISKWEGDAALPEIDKLIGLSKLFGVTVGWLLGVEELPRQEQEPLTEEQLNAMEQLIKLYTTQSQSEETRGFLPLVLSGIAAALALGTLLFCSLSVSRWNETSGHLYYEHSIFSQQISGLQSRVNSLESAEPPADTSSLHRFSFHLTPDAEEAVVNVQLSAIPKRHANETAVFSARKDGLEVSAAECIWDGTAYVGQHSLPMENGYEYWLIITDLQGNQEQIPLQDTQAQNLKNSFHLTCEITELGHLTYQGGELVLNDFAFSLYRPEFTANGTAIHWDKIDVLLVQGGDVISRNALVSQEDDMEFRNSVGFEFSHAALAFQDVALEEGDGLEIWLKAILSNGMECMEMVSSWRYEDGIFYGSELAERVTQN